MKYTNEMKGCTEEVRPGVPEPTMGDLMKETSVAACDALCIVNRINNFLLGDLGEDCEQGKEPACFRDELTKTRATLFRLNNELHKLAHHLGVL